VLSNKADAPMPKFGPSRAPANPPTCKLHHDEKLILASLHSLGEFGSPISQCNLDSTPAASVPEQKALGFVRVTPVTSPEPLPLSGQTISSMMLMSTPSSMAAEAREQSARAATAVTPRDVRPKPVARSKRMAKPMAREEEGLTQLRVPWWRQLLSLRLP